jgi:diacylglycerol kinase (ATP)
VVNPSAGAGRGTSKGARAVKALRALGYEVADLSARDLAGATASARQGVVDGIDALVVVGGDGMANLGANIVAATNLPLGIVPEGTGNDVARSLGLPVRHAAAAVEAIDRALREGPRVIDAVKVTDAVHESMTLWFAGVLTAGFDAAVNARANAMSWPSGSGRYVRALLAELGRFAPYAYRVTVDGEVWESEGTLVSVANGRAIGGGMLIAPDAELDDGLLDVILAGPLTRGGLLKVFPKVYSGRHTTHPALTVRRGRVVVIEPAAAGPPPPDAYADGELIGALPLRCEVVPGALRVLAPRPARTLGG